MAGGQMWRGRPFASVKQTRALISRLTLRGEKGQRPCRINEATAAREDPPHVANPTATHSINPPARTHARGLAVMVGKAKEQQ